MARPRKANTGLPPYVYRRGNWLYHYSYSDGRLCNPVKLCRTDTPLSLVWQKFEELQGTLTLTVERLAAKFEDSPQFMNLALATRKDYTRCREVACAFESSAGPFGKVAADRVTPGTLRGYVDKRSKQSASRARHEGRWLKLLFSWGFQRDLVPSNPGRGVKIGTERRRMHYITDADLQAFLGKAARSASPWLAPYAEIGVRCRLRPSETLSLNDSHIIKLDRTEVKKALPKVPARQLPTHGLLCQRTKGSDPTVVYLTGKLLAAVERARAIRNQRLRKRGLPVPIDPQRRFLFVSPTGSRLTYSGMHEAWRAVMHKLPEEQRFTPHDLKRKGISDDKGDKRKGSGHRSPQMVANYDVKMAVVLPAGA